jgi:hypothetical protein
LEKFSLKLKSLREANIAISFSGSRYPEFWKRYKKKKIKQAEAM